MFIKWSRILQKCYGKREFCCMVAFRTVTRVGNRLEFKLVLDLSMGQGWLLRPYCILLAEFWQTHDHQSIQQNYICPGCGCAAAAQEHFERREQWCLCWEHSCLGRKSLSVTTSGFSTRGSTSTVRAAAAWLDLVAEVLPRVAKANPWEKPWEWAGARGSICTWRMMIFPVLRAELCPPFPSALPLPVNCQVQAQPPPSPLSQHSPAIKTSVWIFSGQGVARTQTSHGLPKVSKH